MIKIISPVKINRLLLVAMLALAAGCAVSQEPFSINTSPLPASTGFVNDFAGVIDDATRADLESKLANLKATTNPPVELAVAVVKTTGERPIFEYSLAVARGWKIGTKEDDNPSALLLVAIDDRKYFTQVSRDLEDELPDGVVGSIQRQFLVPEFRKGNYAKGIADTLDKYVEAIRNKGNVAGVANAEEKPPERNLDNVGSGVTTLVCCGGIGLILLLIFLGRSKGGPGKGDRDRWGGGGFGGGGRRGRAADALPWIIGGILAGSGSSSGSSGSSDWGGSSGEWGGFGGGGDFGGGGAGGDW